MAMTSATLKQATWAIAVVAGLWTLFDIYWNLSSQTGRDFWGTAMIVLFLIALVVAFMQFGVERSALEQSAPQDPRGPQGRPGHRWAAS